jgi:hypothetical protein
MASIAANDSVFALLIAVSFLFWNLPAMFPNTFMPVRAIFSWSFDRILPSRLSDVSERTHAPIPAIIVASIIVAAILTWSVLSSSFAALGRDKQGMTVFVVQQEQGPAPQDDAQTPNQPSWDEGLTVDRLPVSIHIAGQRKGVFALSCVLGRMPEPGGPAREGISEAFGPIGTGDLRQIGFGIPIAIGTRPSGEQRQAIGSVAAQIPRPV